ncbi:4-hydroxy-3-methylbut-2-enyl diphosphate reductase [Kibdelosporangium banguiense]|uniref:4-hydroxy-3-methylbut-2-enyl diphosphate reductase n=1 Tax=Kibdelosporangium banguiense TaxID=1365924 RepID=A0ABS4TRX8_9PSEU|nr:4-hydroxy-3-methylbut-2-enyl diphosphate reductase [Kibdelosporangium banguiense]MBP2327157.1 4-hydroxy-3-methylbut-2-enyl diphosphate reductase [Kibdelosporangium banguiense]
MNSENDPGVPIGKTVVLAEPRSFCAGVRRAIGIVEAALERFGPPIYVRNQIVHNHHVVRALEQRDVHFVSSTEEVPRGAVCVLSAHGVSPAVREAAAARDLRVIDATCPLVSKVHQQVIRAARDDRTVLLVGHMEHEEVEGTYGEAPDRTIVVSTVDEVRQLDLPEDTPVTYVTQTTLSIDDTREIVDAIADRFTDMTGPGTDDICYASQNRQNAVKALAQRTDVVLIVGSENSSNTVRMVEVAQQAGVRSYLVPDVEDLDESWLHGATSVGVSAGASAPEFLVEQLLDRLAELGLDRLEVEVTGSEADITFGLPSAVGGTEPVADTGEQNTGESS